MELFAANQPVFIQQVQSALDDFFYGSPTFQMIARLHVYPSQFGNDRDDAQPKFFFNEYGVIQMVDPRCPSCGHPLSMWGTNPRTMILDQGHVPEIHGVQRYRCPIHGEVQMDLNSVIAPGCAYAENWRRRARQLVADGHTPPDVVRIFNKCFGCSPSESSIRGWVAEAADAAGITVHEGNVPTSGYYGCDEIHANLRGNRVYIQTSIDLHTKFVPAIGYALELSDMALEDFFLGMHVKPSSQIEGLVLDGLLGYDRVLSSPAFDGISIQQCQTHVKKNLTEKIYDAAGLGHKFKQPLPEPYNLVKKLLFAPFNRSSQVKAEFTLAYADLCLEGKVSKKVDKIIDNFYKKFDSVFQYLSCPALDVTNNKVEQLNHKLERYPTLKTAMQTGKGMKRIADMIAFTINHDQFPVYNERLRNRLARLRDRVTNDPTDIDAIKEIDNTIQYMSTVAGWQAKYDETFNRYFQILD